MLSSATNSNVHRADDSLLPAARPAGVAVAVDDPNGRGLRRGLQVLDTVLQGANEGVRVVDLCRRCGLERATIYRILATLIDTGYVVPRGRFRYAPGPRTAPLTVPVEARDLAARLQPVLARVSTACGDAAFAVVREGTRSRCIARQIGTYPVQILSVQVGTRQPLGVGAAGLALLAALQPDDAMAVIGANGDALGSYGDMTSNRLELLVRSTRERGWSVVGNHAVKGALGVGLAIGGPHHDSPLAAISVAASIGRMPKERQQLIAGLMREALAAVLPGGL